MHYYIIIACNAYSQLGLSCIIEIKKNAISNKLFLIHFFNCFHSQQLLLFNCIYFTMFSAYKHTDVFLNTESYIYLARVKSPRAYIHLNTRMDIIFYLSYLACFSQYTTD